jgi:hypothetical protein
LRDNEEKTVLPIDLYNLLNLIVESPETARLDLGKSLFEPIDKDRKCDEAGK